MFIFKCLFFIILGAALTFPWIKWWNDEEESCYHCCMGCLTTSLIVIFLILLCGWYSILILLGFSIMFQFLYWLEDF